MNSDMYVKSDFSLIAYPENAFIMSVAFDIARKMIENGMKLFFI